jgi:putative addiction module CopG family antidote
MKVELPRHATAFVKRKVRAGAFVSEADVVSEALRLMRLRDADLADLRIKVARGIKSLDQGRGVAMTEERWAHIKAEGRRRAASKRSSTAA